MPQPTYSLATVMSERKTVFLILPWLPGPGSASGQVTGSFVAKQQGWDGSKVTAKAAPQTCRPQGEAIWVKALPVVRRSVRRKWLPVTAASRAMALDRAVAIGCPSSQPHKQQE
jgi:hypothetical protein